MKRTALALAALALFTACAGRGRTQFSGTGVGTVEVGVACVTDELRDDEWQVGPVSEAGMIRADNGPHWMEITILQGQELSPAYLIRITTSGTDVADDTAAEMLADCGT